MSYKHWDKKEIKYLKQNYSMLDTYEIAEYLGRNIISVRNEAKALKLRKLDKINIDFFMNWSNDMAYVLGLWFADGCIMYKSGGYFVSIVSKDKQYLENIGKIIGYRNKLYGNSNNTFELRVGSKTLYKRIKELGGIERKSLKVGMPYIPQEYLFDFVRGFFDGDGSVHLGYAKYLTMKFHGHIPFLKQLMKLIFIKSSIVVDKRKENFGALLFYGKCARELMQKIYNNQSCLCLQRKCKQIKESIEYREKMGYTI